MASGLDLLRSLFGLRTAVIRTPISAADVMAKLRAITDPDIMLFGARPIRGMTGPNWARVRKRLPYTFHNSFQTVVQITVFQANNGAELRCTSWMSPFVAAFAIFWIYGVTRFGALDPFSLGMVAFMLALTTVGRFFARSEHRDVVRIVATNVEGKEIIGDAQ